MHTDGRCGGQRAAVASNLPPCPAPHLLSGPFQPSKLDRVLLYSVLSPRSAAQVGSSNLRLCRRTSLASSGSNNAVGHGFCCQQSLFISLGQQHSSTGCTTLPR